MDDQVRGSFDLRQKQERLKGLQFEVAEEQTSQEAKEGHKQYMEQMMKYAWEED